MRTPAKLLSCLILIVCGAAWSVRAAQAASEPSPQPASPGGQSTLETRLIGTWVLAEATTPGTPSGIGVRFKTFTAGKWEMIQRDPKTGEVIFRHGGTYRLNGDVLEQKVEFASQKTKNYVGQVRKFRITVEKDIYTQIGVGNPFNEVWKRFDGV